MKYFYVGLSFNAEGKIGSRALQWYMKKDYSHTFIEYDTVRGAGANTIYHSSMSAGVGYWSEEVFSKYNTKTHLYKVNVSDEQFRAIRHKIHKHAGEHYAFMQNLGILAVDIAQNMGYDVENPFRDNENCSELVFLALVELHPELVEKYNKNTIRPDHIEEILEHYKYDNVITVA